VPLAAYRKRLQILDGFTSERMLSICLKVGGVGLSYGLMKAITYLTGAEGWGLYSICATSALLLTSLARLGTDTAMLRYMGQALALKNFETIRSALRQSAGWVALASIALATILWLSASFLAEDVFYIHVLFYYLRIASLWVLVWPLLWLATECLRGLGRSGAYMFLQNVAPFAIALLLLITGLTGLTPIFSPDIPMLAYLVGLLLATLTAWWLLLRILKKNKPPTHKVFKNTILLATAGPILTTTVLAVVLGWADTLLMGAFRPAAETGIYAAALRTANLVLMPMHALSGVAAGGLAGLFARGRAAELRLELRRLARITWLLSIPLYLILAVASPFIMGFFGQDFRAGYPLLIIIATGQLLNALCGPTDIVLQMTGGERIYRNLIAIATVVSILLNLALIPLYGGLGAAIANFLSLAVWNVPALLYIRKKYGIWMLRF
jgi:O-antigen/teichoic acid export membrane protein